MTKIKIANFTIGDNLPCFIIAEAGVNHNGSLKEAKKLVHAAKLAGASAIKFQTFITKNLVAIDAPKAAYQKKAVQNLSQFEMLKKLELQPNDFREIKEYAKEQGIIFLPF